MCSRASHHGWHCLGLLRLPYWAGWASLPSLPSHTLSGCSVLCADPDGLPALADKQKAQLQGWVRPDDICDDPKMIKMVSSMAIKQASLAGRGSESEWGPFTAVASLPSPRLLLVTAPLLHRWPSVLTMSASSKSGLLQVLCFLRTAMDCQ